MKRVNKIDKPWRMVLCGCAFVLLLAGCQSGPASNGENVTEVVQHEEVTLDGPQKSYLEDHRDESGGHEPNGTANHSDDHSSAEASSLKKDDDLKTAGNGKTNHTEWNKKSPALHGIAIGDRTSAVTKLLGKELDSYTLEEENSRIQVHEYKGLSVGFNGKGSVHFVEVYGEDASAGLNGLTIGDNPETALKKLGKPESQTDYLLTYEAQGARLKLDIDPGNNAIVSIKLIAAN